MRIISPQNQALLAAGSIVARDFIWFVVRNRTTGDPVSEGIWSGIENVNASVREPDLQIVTTRPFTGTGTLVSVDDVAMVSNLTVQNVTIDASQVSGDIERIVREYDCQQGRVEIYRGLFDPSTNQQIDAAECRFVGFIDEIEIDTPTENDAGSVKFQCVSHVQEVTRASAETRSTAYQYLRQANDDFFKDAETAPDWELFWGSEKGKVPAQKKQKKFLGIF